MTTIVARLPLQDLSMSATQSGSRRLSARVQQKDGSKVQADNRTQNASIDVSKSQNRAAGRKRKVDYEEEDDGFAFTRVGKNKKTRQSSDAVSKEVQPLASNKKSEGAEESQQNGKRDEDIAPKPAKRHRMSFSTPNGKPVQSLRRSKRLSSEATAREGSPSLDIAPMQVRKKRVAEHESKETATKQPQKQIRSPPKPQVIPERDQASNKGEDHATTKITLPMSDTPVIRRNKAMREGRGSKGERRSSLGLRGRRASSLIDSGTSNAIPHQEVQIGDFYKHIESEQLEPRRMRQLLTWCATRAMHAKPKGTDFEDASAKSAARVIEEELLKELANRPELSDWFGREDAPVPLEPLPERPNPKNIQNTEKIAELEQRIQRLRTEKEALEALLRPPVVTSLPQASSTTKGSPEISNIDRSLLSDEDAALLESLGSSADFSETVTKKMNAVINTLGPSVDLFADGVHKIAQYRTAADNVASRILSICAGKLEERESQGRKRALKTEEDRSPVRDMSSVLRGLSRVDR